MSGTDYSYRRLPWWRRWFGIYCVGCFAPKCRGCCGCGDAVTCTAPVGWWVER